MLSTEFAQVDRNYGANEFLDRAISLPLQGNAYFAESFQGRNAKPQFKPALCPYAP